MNDEYHWRQDAACSGQVDLMYRPHQTDAERAIVTVCRRCTVRDECLAEEVADIGPDPQPIDIWGVRGGLSAPERRRRYCR